MGCLRKFQLLWCMMCLLQPTTTLEVNKFIGDDCVADNVKGSCQIIPDCPALFNEIQTAGSPMPLRMRQKLKRLNCGFEKDQPIVCCKSGVYLENKNGEVLTNRNEVDVTGHKNFNLLPTNCGSSKSDRITGGSKTQLYEMPWMALIQYSTTRGLELNCGGTIINDWYVLTAAHCVSFLGRNMALASVLLGEYDVNSDPDCENVGKESFCGPKVQNTTISEVIPHPGYSPQNLSNDIALIRLSQSADFTLYTQQPICLPTTTGLLQKLYDNKRAVVAGWGTNKDGVQSTVLMSVEIVIMSNEDCEKLLKRKINNVQICAAGVPGKAFCSGDSGGPLMYTSNDRQFQIGIVSLGSRRCGTVGVPGVYTDVTYYVGWILDNIHE